MTTLTIDADKLARIFGEKERLAKRVDELLESNTRYLEERRAARRALTELAEAASLVVAEWDLGDVSPAYETLAEDIERLRACLTTHMPVIEGAPPLADDRREGLKEAVLFLLEKSAECEKQIGSGEGFKALGAALFGVSGMVALRLAALDLATKIGDAELAKRAGETDVAEVAKTARQQERADSEPTPGLRYAATVEQCRTLGIALRVSVWAAGLPRQASRVEVFNEWSDATNVRGEPMCETLEGLVRHLTEVRERLWRDGGPYRYMWKLTDDGGSWRAAGEFLL